MKKKLLWIMLLSMGSRHVVANDSVARIAAGGLVLEKTDAIEMVSEELEISTAEVTVSYIFRNHTDSDITELVAFPLPLKSSDFGVYNRASLSADSFMVWVDGKFVPMKIIRTAIMNGKDITAGLRKAGLLDQQIFEFTGCSYDTGDTTGSLCGLSPQQETMLRTLGVPADDLWKVSESVVWHQTFPAGHDLNVKHVYRPGVGVTYADTSRQRFEATTIVGDRALSYAGDGNEACVDTTTLKAINRSKKKIFDSGADTVRMVRSEVEYILGTGKNWRGPIGDFRLRVTKSAPGDVISLCFPGKPRKTSLLTYEFHETNYTAQDRIAVYFYSFE